MIILYKDSGTRSEIRNIVLIFGVGLIGKEIVHSLLLHEKYNSQSYDFHWNNRQQQAADAENLITQFRNIANLGTRESAYPKKINVALVWAAGRAGFASSNAEMEEEKTSFKVVLEIYQAISRSDLCNILNFHFVSSAGGLFESQRFINKNSTPSPCRPYGSHKLNLEELLLNSIGADASFIYRPSSVYGLMSGGRLGLIATLIKNGLQNKEVKILGNMDTLRDYVFCGDIGQHIAKRIISNANQGRIEILASGRPMSILQLKIIVEQVINRKIYICTSTSNTNSEDITFDASSLPADWRPTEINLGVRKVYADFF